MYKIVRLVLLAGILQLAVSITDEQKSQIQAELKTVGEACIKEFPLSDEDVTAFKDRHFPTGDNAGCFTACVLRNIGFFDESGTLTKEPALEHAKKIFEEGEEVKTVEEFIDTCAKVNDEPVAEDDKGCERAKLLYNCYTENIDKFDF